MQTALFFHSKTIGDKMQYLKQTPDGDRVAMTFNQHMIDSYSKDYSTIIASGSIIVYRMFNEKPTRKAEPRLKYGGKKDAVFNRI